MSRRAGINDRWYDDISSSHSSTNIKDILLDSDKEPSAVRSVFRSANILACLSNGINSITDIATYCNLNKATVHRLLKALGESHLTMQDPISHRYYLGYSMARIVSNPRTTHEYLITCSLEQMGHLADITEETIVLTVLIGIQPVMLRDIPSKKELKVVERSSELRYVPAGATAKALLSQLDSRKLRIALYNMHFEPLLERTQTDKDKLVAQLRQIKRQGYAVSTGEVIEGASCISVPIKNYVLPAALSILGPDSRMKSRMPDFLRELKAAARKIEDKITETFITRPQ